MRTRLQPGPLARPPPRAPPSVPRRHPPATTLLPKGPVSAARTKPDAEMVPLHPVSARPPLRSPFRHRRLRSLLPHLSARSASGPGLGYAFNRERREASAIKGRCRSSPPKPMRFNPVHQPVNPPHRSASEASVGRLASLFTEHGGDRRLRRLHAGVVGHLLEEDLVAREGGRAARGGVVEAGAW